MIIRARNGEVRGRVTISSYQETSSSCIMRGVHIVQKIHQIKVCSTSADCPVPGIVPILDTRGCIECWYAELTPIPSIMILHQHDIHMGSSIKILKPAQNSVGAW